MFLRNIGKLFRIQKRFGTFCRIFFLLHLRITFSLFSLCLGYSSLMSFLRFTSRTFSCFFCRLASLTFFLNAIQFIATPHCCSKVERFLVFKHDFALKLATCFRNGGNIISNSAHSRLDVRFSCFDGVGNIHPARVFNPFKGEPRLCVHRVEIGFQPLAFLSFPFFLKCFDLDVDVFAASSHMPESSFIFVSKSLYGSR